MATLFSKLPLSGSTNGKGIKVEEEASPGTLIHTAVAGETDMDEVWIYAQNTSDANVKLSLQWGGVAVDDLVEVTIEAEGGLALIIPGLILQNGLVIRAFAGTANVINIFGFVNRLDVS